MNSINSNWADKAHTFLLNQTESWSLLKKNYETLEEVERRIFSFNNFQVEVQYNPGRIISTSADVSAKAIQNRKCFLCKENRPEEQKYLFYNDNFVILVNPFPILPEHFTIASLQHIKQSIQNYIPVLLQLSKDLGDKYSIYYNGPRCGASAPDHLHLQAGSKNILPVERDYQSLKKNILKSISEKQNASVYSIQSYLRNGIVIESEIEVQMVNLIQSVILSLKQIQITAEEPMVNIICSYEKEMWRTIIFPRSAHRPKEYFNDGSEKFLISPAVIDFGGLIITPRKEDFEKLTQETLENIFSQVTAKDSAHLALVRQLTNILS
jgi:ATP adenylyltransferase/5',5'''-P-1,P-4-tetraphosphate phosphorylase II